MQIDGITLERPAPPLNELLGAGLQARPDEVALVSAERSLTWRELDAESARLAGGYRGLGLMAGDRLASLMPNRIDLVVHYLACFRAGLIATPLNYRYTFRDGMRLDVGAAFDHMAATAARAGFALIVNSALALTPNRQPCLPAHPIPPGWAPPGHALHRCATELDLGPETAYGCWPPTRSWLAAQLPALGHLRPQRRHVRSPF